METLDLCISSSPDYNSGIFQAAQCGIRLTNLLIGCISSQKCMEDVGTLARDAVSKFKELLSLLDMVASKHIKKGPLLNLTDINPSIFLDNSKELSPPAQAVPVNLTFPSTTVPQLRVPAFSHSTNPLHLGFRSWQSGHGSVGDATALDSGGSVISSMVVDGVAGYRRKFFQHNEIDRSRNGFSLYSSMGEFMERVDAAGGKCASTAGACHCSRRRKPKKKRVVRVPALSSRLADIPADDFTWRKYGQKPIKGSSHPRSYYKCSSLRGCPARKHVERCSRDPTMLIVTYEGDHTHAIL